MRIINYAVDRFYIALGSALDSSRLTALACDSTLVTGFI